MSSPPFPPAPPSYDPPMGELPAPPSPAPRPPLQRSRSNRVIGGVSGGLAEYTGVDALLWRVGFVAVTLAWGVGLIVYPLLWLLMPAAPVDPTAPVVRAQRAPAGPRSPVPGVTLAVVLILVGIGALLTRFTGIDLGARAFLGGALLVVGVGLAVAAVTGARRGSKIGLIVLGVVLSFAAVAATTVRVPDAPPGDRSYRPLTAAAVQSEYDSGVGDLTLDLTDVDLADVGRPISVTLHAGIGDVEVVVPRSADVQVQVDNGIGDADVFGEPSDGGFHPGTGSAAWTDDDDAELRLTIESGIGDVEVSRG